MTNTYGDTILDGNLEDWSLDNRLDYVFNPSVAGYEIYGKFTGDADILILETDGKVSVTQEINGQTANVVIATETGGKNVHFAT